MSSTPLRRRVRRSAVALMAAAPALLVPVAAAHADALVNGPAVNAAFGAQAGDIAAAPDGSATIAWSGGPEQELWTRHVAPDGAAATPVSLGAASPGTVPAMAASSAGVTAIAWLAPAGPDRSALHVATLDPSGAVRHDTTLATTGSDDARFGLHAVGIDADGAVTVAWADSGATAGPLIARVARVSPAGVAGPTLDLGPTAQDGPAMAANGMQVTETPDGRAWVGWLGPDYRLHVVRLAQGGGSVEASSATPVSGTATQSFRLTSSAAGAAVAWLTPDPDKPGDGTAVRVAGVRLPADGALTGVSFTSGPFSYMAIDSAPQYDLSIAPDGTVSLLYTDVDSSTTAGILWLDRVAPGQSGGSPAGVAAAQAGRRQSAPSLGTRSDGTALAAWLERDDGGSTARMMVRRIPPDGAFGPALEATRIPVGPSGYWAWSIRTQLGGEGAMFGLGLWSIDQDGDTGWDLSTTYLDVTGPMLTVDVPGTATALRPVVLAATVADPVGATVTWDYGDGESAKGTAVRHVYAASGTYTVTASASDTHDNETVVTRTVTVAEPTETDGTPPIAQPTPTPIAQPTPTPTPQGAPQPQPKATPAVSAALKVTAATRKGAKVTVSGTIAAKASGTVTIAYAQKVGRKTIKVKKTAKIAKGRWKVTLTLPKSLTRGAAARGKGTVTASFAGSATVKKATAKRTVAIVKAKAKKK